MNPNYGSGGEDDRNSSGAGDGADDRLIQRARREFDESLSTLDARTRSRLNQARHAALAELENRRASRLQWGLAGVAAAAVATVVVLWQGISGVVPQAPVQQADLPLEDMDIVTDGEDLELLREVEFYAWVGEQVDGAPGNTG